MLGDAFVVHVEALDKQVHGSAFDLFMAKIDSRAKSLLFLPIERNEARFPRESKIGIRPQVDFAVGFAQDAIGSISFKPSEKSPITRGMTVWNAVAGSELLRATGTGPDLSFLLNANILLIREFYASPDEQNKSTQRRVFIQPSLQAPRGEAPLALACLATPLHAQTIAFDNGAGTGLWSAAANWACELNPQQNLHIPTHHES